MHRFRPERAESIGLILHYACTNRCAHCLYACRPGLGKESEPDDWDRLLDAVGVACPEAAVHIGGGEPFLHLADLIRVIQGLRRRGIHLEYVETNGFWAGRQEAGSWLQEVHRAGCDCLLLSISPFHNAFLSCRENELAFRMIVERFGPGGIFPWHPAHYPFLRRVDPSRPVPFEEYAGHFTPGELRNQLTGINYLHLAGRAAWKLASFFPRQPPAALLGKRCEAELSSPVHAHLDARGRYFTGFCAGLQIGDREGLDLDRLFREGIALSDFPVLRALLEGGLAGLWHFARDRGFEGSPAGYVSACHLCGHIRTWLFERLAREGAPPPAELAPAFFYEELGLLIREADPHRP